MGECEVCGEGNAEFVALIMGAKMHVCYDCSKRGKVLVREAPPPKQIRKAVARPAAVSKEIDFVADFGDRIRHAREKMRIGVDVLAELVKEKESYLRRVDAGNVLPNEELARKLEKELGIKLFEEISHTGTLSAQPKKSGPLTLGDMVVVKKKGAK